MHCFDEQRRILYVRATKSCSLEFNWLRFDIGRMNNSNTTLYSLNIINKVIYIGTCWMQGFVFEPILLNHITGRWKINSATDSTTFKLQLDCHSLPKVLHSCRMTITANTALNLFFSQRSAAALGARSITRQVQWQSGWTLVSFTQLHVCYLHGFMYHIRCSVKI